MSLPAHIREIIAVHGMALQMKTLKHQYKNFVSMFYEITCKHGLKTEHNFKFPLKQLGNSTEFGMVYNTDIMISVPKHYQQCCHNHAVTNAATVDVAATRDSKRPRVENLAELNRVQDMDVDEEWTGLGESI